MSETENNDNKVVRAAHPAAQAVQVANLKGRQI
jgi:hypothetical protein